MRGFWSQKAPLVALVFLREIPIVYLDRPQPQRGKWLGNLDGGRLFFNDFLNGQWHDLDGRREGEHRRLLPLDLDLGRRREEELRNTAEERDLLDHLGCFRLTSAASS